MPLITHDVWGVGYTHAKTHARREGYRPNMAYLHAIQTFRWIIGTVNSVMLPGFWTPRDNTKTIQVFPFDISWYKFVMLKCISSNRNVAPFDQHMYIHELFYKADESVITTMCIPNIISTKPHYVSGLYIHLFLNVLNWPLSSGKMCSAQLMTLCCGIIQRISSVYENHYGKL